MKISDQAVGAIMMALQKSLMEQSDIVPVIKGFEFVLSGEEEEKELFIKNPPLVKFDEDTSPYMEELEADGE